MMIFKNRCWTLSLARARGGVTYDFFSFLMFLIGISLKTQELYAVVFLARYLDLFTDFISLYNTVMKLVFIGSSLAIVWCMRMHRAVKRSYDKELDTFQHHFLILASFVMALLLHEKFTFLEVISFSLSSFGHLVSFIQFLLLVVCDIICLILEIAWTVNGELYRKRQLLLLPFLVKRICPRILCSEMIKTITAAKNFSHIQLSWYTLVLMTTIEVQGFLPCGIKIFSYIIRSADCCLEIFEWRPFPSRKTDASDILFCHLSFIVELMRWCIISTLLSRKDQDEIKAFTSS